MTPLLAKTCELHVHPGGCLTAEDILDLGKDVYADVDWTPFTKSYEDAFGLRPDPVALFQNALARQPGGLDKFKEHYIFVDQDGGDFKRFQAKFNLIICLIRHQRSFLQRQRESIERVVARHRQEGVEFVEYRCSCGTETPQAFQDFHLAHAVTLKAESQHGMTARYIISLRRWAATEDYLMVRQLMEEHPEIIPTIVGVDFSYFEEGYPPKILRPLFERIHRDNLKWPERTLDIVYHVGESYFDKSLESAVRWCHEVAEMGAKRLGHAIALGLDPAIAIARQPDAHTTELVSERLDQIAYDLDRREKMSVHGVVIDPQALTDERQVLRQKDANETIQRPYDGQRLDQIRRRQQYVLNRLADRGTVIESCPTSNLRIGGVPDPSHHPVHQFLSSDIDLVISADDPGIFDTSLGNEIDWVLNHTRWSAEDLDKRLGDPRRFQLGSARPK